MDFHVSEPLEQQPNSDRPQPREETKTPLSETPVSDERQSGTDAIFGDTDPANAVLFPGNVAEGKTKSSIFESEDSDDGLFGRPGPKRTKREGATGRVETAEEKKKKKPLFNDSSSDEDLFSVRVGGVRRRGEHVWVSGFLRPRLYGLMEEITVGGRLS